MENNEPEIAEFYPITSTREMISTRKIFIDLNESEKEEETLFDFLSKRSDCQVFFDLISRTKNISFLQNDFQITLLVPVDESFSKDKDLVDNLKKDCEKLEEFINRHILCDTYSFEPMPEHGTLEFFDFNNKSFLMHNDDNKEIYQIKNVTPMLDENRRPIEFSVGLSSVILLTVFLKE